MSSDLQCHITINNRMHDHLKLLKTDLPWGQFSNGPEGDIPPAIVEQAFIATGASFPAPSGTSGTVTYQVGDDANNTIAITWDIPSVGSNKVDVTTSDPDVGAQMSGFKGSGDVEDCLIKVVG